ncbi:MerR family transcriptional regulator [Brenneria populi]|uniref:MerR family transcriptional regulator n=1 Tax=Brenneria populi TaxID=1505588 RepID=A0ABU6JSH1_9GAMM|nr:MerR family transcriptional regulator [Brenneria populi Li et al. 2015]
MAIYTISEFVEQCGISPATLRAWQRRYGLLQPQRTPGGHRLYNDEDLKQVQRILVWLKKGVSIGQVKPLLADGAHGYAPEDNWRRLQDKMLAHLQQGQVSALRHLLYETGREYPRAALVDNVLRPLRARLSGNHAALRTLREILDGQIMGYSAFCLAGNRRRRGQDAFLAGWHLRDGTEVWLEALKRSTAAFRFDVLGAPLDDVVPETQADKLWVLVTAGPLTQARRHQLDLWQAGGLQVVVVEI